MTHLKLIKNKGYESTQEQQNDDTQSFKKENEKESTLKNLEQYSNFFLKRKLAHPNEEYSKFFLIFAYNYFHFGYEEKARKMLNEVSPTYFNEKIISDMDEAMEHRNKADEYKRKRR
ncbi:MAG: hypothetical protein HQK51_20400, partial [Oligoflexia bacterium]|nr:hypothetical protein [Oligoflexia bacterium]